MDAVTIRQATEADADAIADLSLDSSRDERRDRDLVNQFARRQGGAKDAVLLGKPIA